MLEKALAKVSGNYVRLNDLKVDNIYSLNLLTGNPVFWKYGESYN